MDKYSRSIINEEEKIFAAIQLPRQKHESKKSSSSLDRTKSHKSKSSSKHHSSSSKHLSSEKESLENRDIDYKKSKSSSSSHKRSCEEAEFKDIEHKSKRAKSDGKLDKTSSFTSSSSKSSSSSHKTDKHKSSSSSSSRSSKSKKPAQFNIQTPDLLTQKPKLDLSPDLVDDLNISAFNILPPSSKSPNGPQKLIQPKHGPTESELLTKSISSIKSRTKIFSGNTRGGSTIPTLNDMCLRVLTLHLNYVGCIGDIPFDILRPALEKAKPEQLTKIEYYNPYLLDDSDILWKTICQRKWKNRQPVEMESWREMYERCNREDEAKLNRLTKNIRQTQQQSLNCVQKTKIAFVDTVMKGPRGIARKPEPFSSTRKPVISLAVRVEALKSSKPNFVVPKDVQSRVEASFRDGPQPVVKQSTVHRTTLTKPAPMMAKLLSKFRR